MQPVLTEDQMTLSISFGFFGPMTFEPDLNLLSGFGRRYPDHLAQFLLLTCT